MIERRKTPFAIDEAKFTTQKVLSYGLMVLFATVVESVFLYSEEAAERSMVMQTVINITMIVVGFWLGSSKGAADNRDQLNKMLQPQADSKVVTTITTDKPDEPRA